jgi:hypothetical protein
VWAASQDHGEREGAEIVPGMDYIGDIPDAADPDPRLPVLERSPRSAE